MQSFAAATTNGASSDVDTLQEDWLSLVETYMRTISDHSFAGTRTGEVLSDAAASEGKMLRPKLLLICAAFGPLREQKRERLCMLAAMVELTHLASLIHDDIVDEANVRRGKPSVQAVYGKDAAVFAGDFLMARINYFEAKERLNEAAEILSRTTEQMCVGEIGQARCRYREDVTQEEYLNNIQGKTTALFRAACQIGASESGCSADVAEKLVSIGERLGILFQLRDDLLDFTKDVSTVGKETHKDFRSGIYTMPVLLALQAKGADKELLPLLRRNKTERLTDEEIRRMEETVIALGGVEGTLEKMRGYREAIEELLEEFDGHAAAGAIRRVLSQMEGVA